jgi:histidine triad (HIT) family protein
MPCVFCDILSDAESARFVARRTSASAFLPLPEGSLAPLHTLVVPNRHVTGIMDAEEVDIQVCLNLVQQVARAMVDVLGAGGINLLNASGPHSEQSVPHLHFHVVPRWRGDAFTTWPIGRSQHELPESAFCRLSEALALP